MRPVTAEHAREESSLLLVVAPPPRRSRKCLASSRAFRQSPDYLALLQAPSHITAAGTLVLARFSQFLLALDPFARPFILAPLMADQSSAKDFFARARAKGSEKDKASIHGEEVKKELQKATKRNYRWALKLWDQYIDLLMPSKSRNFKVFVLFRNIYQMEHPGASPEGIESPKDFMRGIAFGIEGQCDDPWACMSSVVQTYKNFTGGWQWKGHQKIAEIVILSASNVSLPQLFTNFTMRLPLLMVSSSSNTCCNRNLDFLRESDATQL